MVDHLIGMATVSSLIPEEVGDIFEHLVLSPFLTSDSPIKPLVVLTGPKDNGHGDGAAVSPPRTFAPLLTSLKSLGTMTPPLLRQGEGEMGQR